MAEVYILNKTTTIQLLKLDALLSESYSRESDVTEYPVEDGAIISDHIYNKPVQVELQGGISSYHLDDSLNFYSPDNAFEYLEELQNKRSLITITTGLKTYINMGITNLSIERDQHNSGRILKFSLSARQINIVKATYINPVNVAPKIRKKAVSVVKSPPLRIRSVSFDIKPTMVADKTSVVIPRY